MGIKEKREKELKRLDKAINNNPSAEAYSNRGVSKHESGDNQGAIEDYTKAIEIDPKYARAYNNRGNSKNELGDYQGAIKDCNKAIGINPKIPAAYSNRGNSKGELGNEQGAIDDYNKAIEIDPKYAIAYYNLGESYRKLGQEDKARENFRSAQKIDPTIVSEKMIKDISREVEGIRKEVKEAEAFQEIIKAALKEYKRNSEVWLNASIVATVIVAGILICLAICNDAKQDVVDMGRITLNIFILTILFLIIRQYSNAKKLAIETNNRLIASKLFNNVKNSDDDDIKPEVKETAYPKIIDAIVDSPYNQGHEGKSDNIVDKLLNALSKK